MGEIEGLRARVADLEQRLEAERAQVGDRKPSQSSRKRPQTHNSYVVYATAPPKGEEPPLWATAADGMRYRRVQTWRKVIAIVAMLVDQGQSGDILRNRVTHHRRGGTTRYAADLHGRDEWKFGRGGR